MDSSSLRKQMIARDMWGALILLLSCIALAITGCSNDTGVPVDPQSDAGVTQQVPNEIQVLLDNYIVPDEDTWSTFRLAPPVFDQSGDPYRDYEIYSITLLWGSLANLSLSSLQPVNWSGRLTATVPSVMRVRTTIDFDPEQDSLLPAIDPSYVQWASTTNSDFDGLSLLVFVRKNILTAVLPELFFETRALNLKWPFQELAQLDAYYSAGFTGGLVIHSRRLRPAFCPHGIMQGQWIKEHSFDDLGRFEGMWLSHNGIPLGYLNGRYWTSEDGRQLLEGSVSGLYTDQVIARLRGHWGYDDMRMCMVCGIGHGGFAGKIYLTNSSVAGEFRGEFGDWSLPPDDLVMPFSGGWKLHCPSTGQAESELSE